MEDTFLSLCMKSSVEDIQTYVRSNNPNIHIVDTNLNNAFIYSCMYTDNVEVLKYLVNELKIDVHRRNKQGNNGLLIACKDNPTLDIIRYLVDGLNFSLNAVNDSGLNALLLACMRNKNPNVVKYLVDQGIPLTYSTPHQMDGFLYACMRNNNTCMIDYLVNDCGVDIEIRDIFGNTGFMLACKQNNSLDIVKHLVKLGANTNVHNYSSVNSFILACVYNANNTNIIRYLIDETALCIKFLLDDNPISIVSKQLETINHIYKYIHSFNFYEKQKYEIVRHLIDCPYDTSKYVNHTKLQITSIHDLSFSDVKRLHDNITYNIDIPSTIDDIEFSNEQWKRPYFIDYLPNFEECRDGDGGLNVENDAAATTKELEPICSCTFTDANEPVILYGHKIIVYSMIPLFQTMHNNIMIKGQSVIQLEPNVSKHVFLRLLTMCYTGLFDDTGLSATSVVEFIKIVDMYKPRIVDITDLEPYIIRMDIPAECMEFLERIADLYEFKYLFTHLKNITRIE